MKYRYLNVNKEVTYLFCRSFMDLTVGPELLLSNQRDDTMMDNGMQLCLVGSESMFIIFIMLEMITDLVKYLTLFKEK